MAEIATTSRRSRARRPRRTVAGPRADRRAERRQAILAAALKEFSARGFAAARLDDIADAAGIAKGTIYLYFRDKETLFQDLILSEMGPVVATLETALARRPAGAGGGGAGGRAVRARDLRHQPPGDHPAHPQRGAALSATGRFLLSRGARAHHRGGAGALAARARARRIAQRRHHPVPAIAGCPRHRGHHLERPVRAARSARRARA